MAWNEEDGLSSTGEAPVYVLAASPRTGSSWLCGMLSSVGTAGYPVEYAREAISHALIAGRIQLENGSVNGSTAGRGGAVEVARLVPD